MILTINQGKILGKEGRSTLSGKKYYSFLGIPYAKPPVGDLRFKPPQKANGWSNTFEAVNEGNICIQFDRSRKDLFGSEDCLYLNVFTPVIPSRVAELKPVMVNVHGGGFFWLSGSLQCSSPDNLIEYDVVLVTFNYRLNVLGFLNLGLENCPGNVGLKDQLMAFQWVKDNIQYFGGDPNNITVFGPSAGASSIHLHLTSPLSQNLFHKCILQSGYALSTWSFCEEPLQAAFELGVMLGYRGTDTQELLDFLKRIPANQLIEATVTLKSRLRKRYPGICSAYPFLPSVETIREGAILTDHPRISFKKARKIPIMLGMVNKEGANIFLKENQIVSILRQKFVDVIKINVPVKKDKLLIVAKKIKEFYFGNRSITEDTADEIADLYTDFYFKDFYNVLEHLMENSEHPVYTYQFSYVGYLNPVIKPNINGAIHGAEHFYLFGSKFFNQNPFFFVPSQDISVIKKMCTLWTNFAKSGNPNYPRAPALTWRPTSFEEGLCYLQIDTTFDMKTGKMNEERYIFWQTLAEYMQTQREA